MTEAAAPWPLRLYGGAANLLAPMAYGRVSRKLRAQGADAARLPERMGHATRARPEGRVVWFHAASVGESLSVLRLIDQLAARLPDLSFLITSGTATSARILSDRMPRRCVHQFPPLDSHRAVGRFLDHWAPSAAVFVESELWPQMLRRTAARGIPLALVNARMSDGSARNWARLPQSARHLLAPFRMIHCQDARTAGHLRALGLDHARAGLNLKSLSGPLPHDPVELERMKAQVQDRPVWLAASTHPGEEALVLRAHQRILERDPRALLILVPRHPDRADALEVQIAQAGLEGARRASGMAITPRTRVYLADTLGEMGLWYALCPLTCLCGSFSDVGGHNPFEPAHAGSAIVHGPRYANFAGAYADLAHWRAAIEVADAAALADVLDRFLDDPDGLDAMRDRARAFAQAQDAGLDGFAEELSQALELE